MYPRSQGCAVIVDQHQIVAVVLRYLRSLQSLQSDQNASLLFAFDGNHDPVADHADMFLVVHMNATRWFSFGHGTLSDLAVVDHSEAS